MQASTVVRQPIARQSIAREPLARELERDRLEHRVARIERVTAALRDRAVHRHAITGSTPSPLRHAIADFEIELARLRHRLSELRALDREQCPTIVAA